MIDISLYSEINVLIEAIKGSNSLPDFVSKVNNLIGEDNYMRVVYNNAVEFGGIEFKGKNSLKDYFNIEKNTINKTYYKSIRKLLYLNNLDTIITEIEKITNIKLYKYDDGSYRFNFINIKSINDLKKELVELEELKLELRHQANHIEFSEDGDYAILDGVALVYLTEDNIRKSNISNSFLNNLNSSNSFDRFSIKNSHNVYGNNYNNNYGNGYYNGSGMYVNRNSSYSYSLRGNPIEDSYACVGQLKKNKKDIQWLKVNEHMYIPISTTSGVTIKLLYTMRDSRDYKIYRHGLLHPTASVKPYPVAILEDGSYSYSFKPLKGGIIGGYRKYRQRKKANKGLQSSSSCSDNTNNKFSRRNSRW